MIERYVLPDQTAVEREFLPAHSWWTFCRRFNVAPQQYVPAIRIHDGQTEGLMMRWGFIASWAEGKPAGEPPPNVDIDRIEGSKRFRMPWLESQRCIVPVEGFYLWHLTEEKYRQPYYVRIANRAVFGLAAVWDRSVGKEDDDVIESFSVVSIAANPLIEKIANMDSVMPAILRRKDYQVWLSGTPVAAKAALTPYSAALMEAHAVSPRVNSVQPDDAGLIAPI